MMTGEDFDEFVKLLRDLRRKAGILAELFPVVSLWQREFTREQKRAIKDADEVWEKFHQKARVLGGLVD